MPLSLLEEFGLAVAKSKTTGQLFKTMVPTTRRLGFDYFAICYGQWIGCTRGSSLLIHNCPEPWAKDHLGLDKSGLYMNGRDPVRRACDHSFQGFRWHEIDQLIPLTSGDRAALAARLQHGIADGFTIPRHLPGQASASCTFAVGPRSRLPVEMLAIAESVGATAVTAAHRIAGGDKVISKPVLSDRQRDCVLLSARGLNADQIADELGIGRETVIHHLRVARVRYDVNCSEALLVCAIADGLFCLADVRRNIRGRHGEGA